MSQPLEGLCPLRLTANSPKVFLGPLRILGGLAVKDKQAFSKCHTLNDA